MVSNIQTEVKNDVRHNPVNGTIFQFLHVKILAIIFAILMFFYFVVCRSATCIFPSLL